MFAAATLWMGRNVEEVNAVNVFPVPDGDTGTNMFATMREVMEEAQRCHETGAGAMLAAMSYGALMGGRGNSGVILSQIIRGMAAAAEGVESITAQDLATGFEQASAAAYKAVTKPAEGTILTVIREVSEAARASVSNGGADITDLLQTAADAAKESVARTPALLPVLAEAGVVDAGGLGLSILLQGMLRYVRGDPIEEATTAETVDKDWLLATAARHETADSLYGYCAELLVGGSGLDVDSMRSRMLELGDSVLVVGDVRLVRVHVHTDDPGAALTLCTSSGSLIQVKVDNIRRQAESFVQMHEERQAAPGRTAAVSSVAIAAGEGMAAVFESVGCTKIVSGGPTMNPSTRDILEAIEACPAEDVVVLPNDKNIILAAQQAVGLTKKRVHVIGTRSMPQGIAALLALNPEEDVEANVAAMEEARQAIRTVEVTRAVRSTTIGGVAVEDGKIIAIVDDELKLSASSPDEAVDQALAELVNEKTSMITLYAGGGTKVPAAQALAEKLRRRFPQHEVEVVSGGQPHYDYLVSLE
jgi:DAK2 domain fusion protein YloV